MSHRIWHFVGKCTNSLEKLKMSSFVRWLRFAPLSRSSHELSLLHKISFTQSEGFWNPTFVIYFISLKSKTFKSVDGDCNKPLDGHYRGLLRKWFRSQLLQGSNIDALNRGNEINTIIQFQIKLPNSACSSLHFTPVMFSIESSFWGRTAQNIDLRDLQLTLYYHEFYY